MATSRKTKLFVHKAANMGDFFRKNIDIIKREVARRRGLPVDSAEVGDLFGKVLEKLCVSKFLKNVSRYSGAQLSGYVGRTVTSVLVNDARGRKAIKRGGKEGAETMLATQVEIDQEEQRELEDLDRGASRKLKRRVESTTTLMASLFTQMRLMGLEYKEIAEIFTGYTAEQVRYIVKKVEKSFR